MLKQTIQYEDLDGNQVEEDFYFHLNEADLAELELSRKGGISAYFQQIIEKEDGAAVIQGFKDIIGMSVGQRSEDQKSFRKTKEYREWFLGTDAYSKLFMKLITEENAGAEFMNGIMPKVVKEKRDAIEAPADPQQKQLKEMNDDELRDYLKDKKPIEMSKEELVQAMRLKVQAD